MSLHQRLIVVILAIMVLLASVISLPTTSGSLEGPVPGSVASYDRGDALVYDPGCTYCHVDVDKRQEDLLIEAHGNFYAPTPAKNPSDDGINEENIYKRDYDLVYDPGCTYCHGHVDKRQDADSPGNTPADDSTPPYKRVYAPFVEAEDDVPAPADVPIICEGLCDSRWGVVGEKREAVAGVLEASSFTATSGSGKVDISKRNDVI